MNGASTVDYTIITTQLLRWVKYFAIADLDIMLSDHCLQRFGLICVYVKVSLKYKTIKPLFDKFEWVDNGQQKTASLVECTTSKLVHFLTNDQEKNEIGVAETVKKFSDILVSAGKKSLKYIRGSKKGNIRRKRNKLGFNEECYSLRKELRSLGEHYGDIRSTMKYVLNFYQKVKVTKKLSRKMNVIHAVHCYINCVPWNRKIQNITGK